MKAVRGESHPVEAASIATHLLKTPGRPDPQCAVVLRPQSISPDKGSARRADLVFPTEFRVAVDGARQHEHAGESEGGGVRDSGRRVANLLQIAAKQRGLDLLELGDPAQL